MFRFIVDTQLPPKLVKYLIEEGFDATHTTDYPEGHLLKDAEIVEIATRENRIILTKDQDFLDFYLLKGSPPKVIMLQFGNIGNHELIKYFQANQNNLIELLEQEAEVIMFSRIKITEYKKEK